MRNYLAEAIGTFALILVGVGAIQNTRELIVALAYGLTIAVMASAVVSISCAHLRPAVTLGLWTGGKISAVKTGKYWVAQLLGATLAGLFVYFLFSMGIAIPGISGRAELTTSFQALPLEAAEKLFLVPTILYGAGIFIFAGIHMGVRHLNGGSNFLDQSGYWTGFSARQRRGKTHLRTVPC